MDTRSKAYLFSIMATAAGVLPDFRAVVVKAVLLRWRLTAEQYICADCHCPPCALCGETPVQPVPVQHYVQGADYRERLLAAGQAPHPSAESAFRERDPRYVCARCKYPPCSGEGCQATRAADRKRRFLA